MKHPRLKELLLKYKLLILIGVPLIFFGLFIALLSSPGGQVINSDNFRGPQSISPTSSIQKPSQIDHRSESEIVEPLDKFEGFQRTETLSDGALKYIYSSPRDGRQNIIITQKDKPIFQSIVTHSRFPIRLSTITKRYGPAKWIFKGSIFYGADAQTHIYPEIGIALITRPHTNEFLEQHIFTPIKVEEYVSKYGDDIPAQP
jgi:hypothetical protein